jgi:hypothetical protein
LAQNAPKVEPLFETCGVLNVLMYRRFTSVHDLLYLVTKNLGHYFLIILMGYLHSPTHNSEFGPYGMNFSYNNKRIDPIFVCRAIRHLAIMSDCVDTPLSSLYILDFVHIKCTY